MKCFYLLYATIPTFSIDFLGFYHDIKKNPTAFSVIGFFVLIFYATESVLLIRKRYRNMA